MKKLKKWCSKQMMRRIVSAVLAVVLSMGILPTSFVATAEQWTNEHIDTLVDWGVMRGDVSGNMNPEKTVTRAEFVTMVNRAFGYTADTTHPFTDVRVQDWFHNDIGIAYNMGYFKGTSETTASPNSPLTREQAVVLIGRNLLLDEKLGETLGFSDSRTFSDWSRGMVESAASAGFIGGYEDGSFKPQQNATRGEIAAMLAKAIGTMVNKSGTHELGGVYGNVMISTSGVKLKNTTIAGDLYVTGGLELGDIMLENVNVLGKIIVSGSGESHKGDSSIVLRNVEAGELVVDSIANQFVTLRAEGNTQIDFTNVKTSAYLDDQTEVGDGLLYIEMNGGEEMNVTLAGNIEEVLNRTPGSALVVAQGTAQIVTVDEKAVESTLDIKNIASINKLNLDIGTPVTGEGSVKDIFVNAAGSVVDMLPDKITIRPGLTADINGEEMDTKEGNESSSEPRILSGYPKIKNLAPNSVEVVYSANKKGTIHWALTSLIDGPMKVEDLLEVKDYNTKILQQGTINVTEANKEFKVKISKLLSDGSYYVSAVLVDSRDQKSPVKYITFTTPDGTAPAFASGYPELTQIKKDTAQVAVMPTKSSKLYYVVLPKGAAAPTVSEFKAGSISGDLGNCPKEGIHVTKNVITLRNITADGKLDELTTYDLYLCLIDPDNGKDSGVKKITFTTVDGTPPILNDAMVTGIQKNSVNVTTSMNEVGTIYWVVVKPDQKYPVPVSGSNVPPALNSKEAILQVVNGMGNVIKAGKVSAKANTDVVLKVTGLQPESSYVVYYVAEDKAGNYSESVKTITVNTLDALPPTVRQEFTKTADAAGLSPLSDTDIKVIFSEGIRNEDGTDSFLNMYNTVYGKNSTASPEEKEIVLATLKTQLEKSIQLWDVSNASSSYQIKHTDNPDPNSAWVNYKKVEIEMVDGELVLTFRNGKAINLNSGSTYQFIIEDVTDTSDAQNIMKPNPLKMTKFTTVFAQVNLSKGLTSDDGAPQVREVDSSTGKYVIAKDDEGKTMDATVDMSFKMNPQSTDNVNGNVNYDMWFESNQLIAFNLYCRVLQADGTPVASAADGMSMFSECGQQDENHWMYVGLFDLKGGSGNMVRGSVNGVIHNDWNTSAISKLNSLRDGYTYEFAIEVVEFETQSDRTAWSEEAMLKVVIPAGQNLSSSDAIRANPWNDDIYNVGNPEDFTVFRQFVDTKTPRFASGYPTFDAGDGAAMMNVILDRAGTMYYVVAPMAHRDTSGTIVYEPSILTQATEMINGVATPIDFEKRLKDYLNADKDDENGPKPCPPVAGTGITDANRMGECPTVIEPTNDAIALMVDKGAASVRIKTGEQDAGTNLTQIPLTDLEPLTTYFVYCILSGVSPGYSDVYLFQFTTDKVGTPTISLERVGSDSVSATVSTAADLNWIVFPNTTVTHLGLNAPFDATGNLAPGIDRNEFIQLCEDLYPQTIKTVVEKDENGNVKFDDEGNKITYKTTSVTIMQALLATVPSSDPEDVSRFASLFDRYASESLKKSVQEKIMSTGSSDAFETTAEGSMTTTTLKPPVTKYPYTFKSESLKKYLGNATYYFLATAKNPLGQDYSFKAIGGLHKQDNTAPSMSTPQHTADWYVAARKAGTNPVYYDSHYNIPFSDVKEVNDYVYRGEVILTFSEPIWELTIDADQNRTAEQVTDTIVDESKNISDFVKRISTIGGIKVYDVEIDGSTITFKYKDATVGSRIVIFGKGFISDANSNVNAQKARLTLEFAVDYQLQTDNEEKDDAGTDGGTTPGIDEPFINVNIIKPYFIPTWSGIN